MFDKSICHFFYFSCLMGLLLPCSIDGVGQWTFDEQKIFYGRKGENDTVKIFCKSSYCLTFCLSIYYEIRYLAFQKRLFGTVRTVVLRRKIAAFSMPKHNYHVLAELFLQIQEGFFTFALSTEMKTLSPWQTSAVLWWGYSKNRSCSVWQQERITDRINFHF